jgi:tetratricopeptide (TPR) repeat protein
MIPANATLIFNVELISIMADDRQTEKIADMENTLSALAFKDAGNTKFKERKYKDAVSIYKLAMNDLKNIKGDEADKLRVILYQNSATSMNYLGDHLDAIENCDRAIAINPKSWKAFFQRGLAHSKLQNFDEAVNDIKEAIKLDPSNKNLRVEFEKVKAEKKKSGTST